MKKIPLLLIVGRIITGLIIFALAFMPGVPVGLPIGLFTAGLLSDIVDGMIARRLGVSTERLRRLDSSADQAFWILVAVSLWVTHPDFFRINMVKILILVGAEALIYIVCFIRFRKEVATHALSSKIWTLVLFATLVQVMAQGGSGWLFEICFCLGIITRLEILGILLLLRQWTNDVPSIRQAWLLHQGTPMRRNKWFNG